MSSWRAVAAGEAVGKQGGLSALLGTRKRVREEEGRVGTNKYVDGV